MNDNVSLDSLRLYDAAADNAASSVIKQYSSSFHIATRLYPKPIRRDIRNLYAVVRIADEIVDGTLHKANSLSGTTECISKALASYEQTILSAPHKRFHTDPIVHAYANTARRCGLSDAHLQAFFRSMRMDLHTSTFADSELQQYIYGSAEVIGLLCLDIFYAETPRPDSTTWPRIQEGAQRLGAGFQKINFLRDYAEDTAARRRDYYPRLSAPSAEEAFNSILAEARSDLLAGARTIKLLPPKVQPAVAAASEIYLELARKLSRNPEAVIGTGANKRRLSVPKPIKVRIVSQAIVRSGYAATLDKLTRKVGV